MLNAFLTIIATYPNMTLRQIVALMVMRGNPNIKSCELAGAMKVHRSVISRTWDTLSRYGLIKRKRGYDARDVHGNLTKDGEVFCNQLMEK